MKYYIMKMVWVLTLFFFSISNISYAAVLAKDESALRGASLAVSETKGSIEAVFASKTPSKTITWPLELNEILDRILKKTGMVIGDVFINRNTDWDIDETGHKEEAVKIARLFKEGAKFGRLLIHTDFEKDFKLIRDNDVVLKVNFGDGVTREISVARGLCYRAFGAMFNWRGKDGGHLRKPKDEGELLWVEDEKEASKVGARYRIINSAIWVWYHFLFKNKDERVRNNNKFASEVLDKFFEVVNNYKKYEQSEDEQLRNIINFRDEIPFLLIEDEASGDSIEKMLKLQNKVKGLILIINALYFKIPETIPEPISLNLLDPALEHFFKGYWQSTDATVDIFQGYAGKYGKIQYKKTRINKLGFKAYITDEGKALIVRDNQLIIAEPPDVVEDGIEFSDDARFLVCIGPKSVKVYNLFSPDKPVVTQKLTGGFRYEFFNKDKTGLYNYIILSTWLEKERVRITVYHLRSGKLMIDEVVEEKQGAPLYRLLGDGRYVELRVEEKLATGITASYLYDLKYSTTPAMPLFPIVNIYKGNLPPVVGDIRFNTDVITEVSYGETDKRISFNPKTAQVVWPKLIDPSEVYDDVGPDIPESFFSNIGMPVNVTRHKGYAAVFQVARFDDKIFEDKEVAVGDRIRLGLFYKVTIFNQEGKPVIECGYPVREFWFSPDGKYVVFYNYKREVEIISLKNPFPNYISLGTFFKLKDVRFTKDNQHIILYDKTTSAVWNIKYLEEQSFHYPVATLNRKEPSHFRFSTHTLAGTERLLVRCKDAELITIDRKTGEVVDISMPEPEEKPTPEVKKESKLLHSRHFGPVDIKGEHRYFLSLWNDQFFIRDCIGEGEIILRLPYQDRLDYRIIGDGTIIELTIGDTYYLYDLRCPQKPLVEGKKFTSWTPPYYDLKFNPELVLKVLCLYTPGKEYNEITVAFDTKGNPIVKGGLVPATTKEDITLEEDAIRDIITAQHYGEAIYNWQKTKLKAGYEIKVFSGVNEPLDTISIYAGPGNRYIVSLNKVGEIRIHSRKNPKEVLYTWRSDSLEFSRDGRFIVKKEAAFNNVTYKSTIPIIGDTEEEIKNIAHFQEKDGSYYFFTYDEKYDCGVKRIAAEDISGRRIWLDPMSGKTLFITELEGGAEKDKRIGYNSFARLLGYEDLQQLLSDPKRMRTCGHYVAGWNEGRLVVARCFPEQKRLQPIIIAGEIGPNDFAFHGPGKIWFTTIDKERELKVYNIEGDKPIEPIYRCQLLRPYSPERCYSFSDNGLFLATLNKEGELEVVDLSYPQAPLAKWEKDRLGEPIGLTDFRGKDLFVTVTVAGKEPMTADILRYNVITKQVEKAGSAEMLIEESSKDEPSAKSSSAGKTTTAEVYKMLIKASDKKIAELLRTLHTRKFRVRDITPYRPAAKIISDKAAGDSQKATQLIDGFARHIKILTKNRLSGVAVNYELGEKKQILTFNDRGWKFYTKEEWRRKLSSWNYFPQNAIDGMKVYYPSDESSARQISYFKSKDPYEPEFAWVRSPVNFTEVNIGLPKPLEAIISAAKSSSAGEVKVGGFDFKVITDNEAFSSSVGPLTTVLKDNLRILRRRVNLDLKFPDLPEHKQVVFANRDVFSKLIKIPGSYPDAYLIIAAIEGEKGQGIKQLAILVQERGQEAETYEIPCVKVLIIQPSIAQIENLGKKLATSATEEKKALSRYLKYLKQQTAAKSSSAGNNVSPADVPDSLLWSLGITRDRITTAMTNSRGYFIIIENSTGREGDDLVDIVSPDGIVMMRRDGPLAFSSSPDNRYVAFVRRDNFLFDVYDLYSPTPTGPIIREVTPDEFQKFQIKFSPDNRHLLCASFWKGVCEQYAVYDLQNPKESIIKYDLHLSPPAALNIKVYFDSTGANLIVETIKEGRLEKKTVPIPQNTAVAKYSSAGNIDSEVVSIDANGGTIKPDSLGVGAQRDEQVKKKIEEALNISKTLVDITAVKSLLLDEQAKLDRSNPIIIAVPDTYVLCPGLREFAESVKDLTTISREPLFQFVVSVDASLPDSDELKELISKVNEAGIIEAKVKMIRALEIPNLRKIIPITTSQAEQPVNATELLIEQLKQSDNIMTMATKRRLIIFQHPQVVTDQNQQIREELEKLAERNGVFIVLPVTDFDKKDKLFDVNSLMLAFLGSLKYTSALSVSAPVLRGMLMIGLPEIKSEDVEKKAEEFHKAILKTLASA